MVVVVEMLSKHIVLTSVPPPQSNRNFENVQMEPNKQL